MSSPTPSTPDPGTTPATPTDPTVTVSSPAADPTSPTDPTVANPTVDTSAGSAAAATDTTSAAAASGAQAAATPTPASPTNTAAAAAASVVAALTHILGDPCADDLDVIKAAETLINALDNSSFVGLVQAADTAAAAS
jgi:hypothetical protein